MLAKKIRSKKHPMLIKWPFAKKKLQLFQQDESVSTSKKTMEKKRVRRRKGGEGGHYCSGDHRVPCIAEIP